MELLVDPKTVQEYGFSIILFCVFLIIIFRNTRLAEKRFSKIEKDLDSANLFIRNDMSEMIRDQQKLIAQNNECFIQHARDFRDMSKIIGSLGRVEPKKYDENFRQDEI